MNFARDVLDRRDPRELALLELARDGSRREWSFGEVAERSARLAGSLQQLGVGRGDVVMTLIGNRPEWVLSMVACFRIGAVVLPCTEQLRAKDLRMRIDVAAPSLIVSDERNREELEAAVLGAAARPQLAYVPDERLFDAGPAPAVELERDDPCLITFTSGTAGEPKAVVHAQRYLDGQRVQAEHWLGARAGELVWCTAASGWSKSARNVFIAPWLSGATALLHDARFDPEERVALLERERVNVLCMAPTEYRVIAKRTALRPLAQLRGMVAAGEALNPEVLRAWREATGLEIRDGYGQTETGQTTGTPLDTAARPGSMGRALPGMGLTIVDGELTVDPPSVPTFFLGYLGEHVHHREDGTWEIDDRAQARTVAHRRQGHAGRGRLALLRGTRRRRDRLRRIPDRAVRGGVRARLPPRRRRGRRRRRSRRGARRGRARDRRPARRRLRPLPRARTRAAGARQARDRAVQVPADRGLRRGAAEDSQRQGQAGGAASWRELSRRGALVSSRRTACSARAVPPRRHRASAPSASRSSERAISVTAPASARRVRPAARTGCAARRRVA